MRGIGFEKGKKGSTIGCVLLLPHLVVWVIQPVGFESTQQ